MFQFDESDPSYARTSLWEHLKNFFSTRVQPEIHLESEVQRPFLYVVEGQAEQVRQAA